MSGKSLASSSSWGKNQSSNIYISFFFVFCFSKEPKKKMKIFIVLCWLLCSLAASQASSHASVMYEDEAKAPGLPTSQRVRRALRQALTRLCLGGAQSLPRLIGAQDSLHREFNAAMDDLHRGGFIVREPKSTTGVVGLSGMPEVACVKGGNYF
jgi:hypothetical protein